MVGGILGHIISTERVEVDLRKTKVVKNCSRPMTPTDIRSFLGLAGYNYRFVDSFASIACPLTTLTQKSKKYEWSEASEISFEILNDRITSTQV